MPFPDTATRPVTILLVEDSEADRFFFKRALEMSGVVAELIVAVDGQGALDLLADPSTVSRIDIVFLDLKLPLLTGFDVLRWVQRQKFTRFFPIVVLTGSIHEKDQTLARELHAADYLVKPLSPELLRKHIAALPQFVKSPGG